MNPVAPKMTVAWTYFFWKNWDFLHWQKSFCLFQFSSCFVVLYLFATQTADRKSMVFESIYPTTHVFVKVSKNW